MDNTYTKYILSILLLILFTCQLPAQSIDVKLNAADDEKITIKPSGRLYMDGAAYVDDKTDLGNGVTLTDIRLGIKAKYKKWDAKVEIGFSESKVSIKDAFIQYNLTRHQFLKLGHYSEPFGMEGLESSAWHKFMVLSPAILSFSSGRQLGLIYAYWNNTMKYNVGIFADNDALNNKKGGDDGYAVIGHITYNKHNNKGALFHVGATNEYRMANANGYDEKGKEKPRVLSYGAGMPTKIDKRRPLGVTIDNADFHVTYAAELLLSYDRFFTQNECFKVNTMRRHKLGSFQATGFYSQLGLLILGDRFYKYNDDMKILKCPNPKSLEFVLRYSYTDLDDVKAQLYGGRMSEISAALNYYVSKYMVCKVNYSYISNGSRAKFAPDENIHIIQGRIVFKF